MLDIIKDEITGKATQVEKQVYVDRVKICLNCPHVVYFLPNLPSCRLCGCFIKTKTKYSLSQCPDSPPRWEAIKLSK